MVDGGALLLDLGGLAAIAVPREPAVELRQALNGAPEQTKPYDRDRCDAGSPCSHGENGSGGASDPRREDGRGAVTAGARTSATTGRPPAAGTPRRRRRRPRSPGGAPGEWRPSSPAARRRWRAP